MKLYQKFRNSSLDTKDLGIYTGAGHSTSVFTPTGARIIGWSGSEGIHFCQVEGFGKMIFAVDPNAPPGDCVHPVAGDLLDFIGLIVTCQDASLIYRAYRWSRAKFELERSAIRPTGKMRSILRALQNTYAPTKQADPYGYIRSLQQEFDYSSLPIHPDFYEWCPIRPGTPKWEVGFGTGFFDYCEKGKAGQTLDIRKTFTWKSEAWCIPAVYLCENGILVDSYLEVPSQQMEQFFAKWGSRSPESMTEEENMLLKLEYPLGIDLTPTLLVNDRTVPLHKSFTLQWIPSKENRWNARRTLEHYDLDREKGYLLRRDCFLRKGKNPPIRTMSLSLQAQPVSIPGQRFIAPGKGASMTFIHPITGESHSLTVLSQTREALDPNFLSNHPCCYTRLNYSLEPEIPDENIRIVDSVPNDPIRGAAEDMQSALSGIYGTDGPTALFISYNPPAVGHCALSSLRYQPAEQITWRMIFKQKPRQDLTLTLMT